MTNVMELIKSGEYIQAIKMHREQTGLGLKESKEYVDQLKINLDSNVLKSSSIDEMKDKIEQMISIDSNQKNFLLDLVEEAYYIGEDSGDMTGYARSLEENNTSDYDDEESLENAYNEGREDGVSEGYRDGFDEGKQESYDNGYNEGYDEGQRESKQQSYDEGYNEGCSEGYDEAKLELNDSKLELYDEGYQAGLKQGMEQFERID